MSRDTPFTGDSLSLASGAALTYLAYLLPEYEAEPARRWPLMLFLHGAGERGNNLALVPREALPRLVADGMDLPFVVAAPQCPEGARWQPREPRELLDYLTALRRVDPDRV